MCTVCVRCGFEKNQCIILPSGLAVIMGRVGASVREMGEKTIKYRKLNLLSKNWRFFFF